LAAKVRRCSRCDRRLRGAALEWGVDLDRGSDALITPGAVICPDCQTKGERVERERNDRDFDYVWVNAERLSMWPKCASN
jgi:hypothetical protein